MFEGYMWEWDKIYLFILLTFRLQNCSTFLSFSFHLKMAYNGYNSQHHWQVGMNCNAKLNEKKIMQTQLLCGH